MSNEKKNEEKKSSHAGGKLAGAALILALLGGGGYFGLGVGNPNGGWFNPATTEAAQQTQTTAADTQATTPAQTQDDGVLKITVAENKILYRGQEVDLIQLEEALLKDYKEGAKVELTDDHAIKSVYDEVSALLQKLKMMP